MVTDYQSLESRLRTLIEKYREVREKNRMLSSELAEQSSQIKAMRELCAGLRKQVDDLGQDRHTLKRLKNERKTIRKNLDTAVKRLAELERELIP